MTPSASASPIVLLASPAAPVPASTATADGGPDSAAGGGFQLLIETATQQQLAAQEVAPGQSGDGEAALDIGNGLPPADLALPVDGEERPDDEVQQVDTDDAGAEVAATAIPLPWVPVNIQPPAQPAAARAGNGRAEGAGQAAGAAGSVTGVQLTGAAANAVATAEADAAVLTPLSIPQDADGIQLAGGHPAPAGSRQSRVTSSGAGASGAALASTSNDLDGVDAAATKADASTRFADLLKPANTQAQAGDAPLNPAVAPLDGGRTLVATRSYLDAGGAAATATVSLPVGSSGWSDAVVDKVMWFSANQLSSAEIKLNPPDLGPLQVRISTQQDQASVVFSSPHAAVRDALDQALPRLREMFGGQGLQLTDASVGGQAQRQQQQQQGSGDSSQARAAWFGSEDNGDTPVAVTRVVGPRLATSAVDAYA